VIVVVSKLLSVSVIVLEAEYNVKFNDPGNSDSLNLALSIVIE